MGKKSKKKRRSGTSNQGRKAAVTSESTSTLTGYNVGDRVVICGLKQATQYNDKIGVIISKPTDRASRYGVSVNGHKISILPSNMKPATHGEKQNAQHLPHHPQAFGDLEELLHHINKKNSVNADQMDMFLTEEQKIHIFGGKIKPMPNFRDELLYEGGGIPRDVDSAWGNNMLRTAFEQCSALPHRFEIKFKCSKFPATNTAFLKRLGTNDPVKFHWYFEQPRMIGDIFPRIMHPYSSEIRHSYSNQTNKKELLYRGTTHVAVGFVDLGIVLEADLGDPPTLRATLTGGPLLFLGVEMSPYAVAKTHVIWEMLRHCQGEDDLRHVMQAWFSTTWEQGAERSVRRALDNLCRSCFLGHPEVNAFLLHWKASGSMSLKNARTQWADRSTKAG